MIHVVVHCYAGRLPQFASFLRYQLSSLVLHPPRGVRVVAEVCCCPEDERTVDVLNWFGTNTDLIVETRYMDPERLFRRCIGRNECALTSHESELVWFTDCDYVFGPGCFDGLWKSWNRLDEYASMIFPREIQTLRTHQIGDRLAADCPRSLVQPPEGVFVRQGVRRAFGGLQIVPGSLARTHGYLDRNRRYQRPSPEPFRDFRDDVAFRKFCLKIGPIVPVDVPNLFRLRHTATTYQGQTHGQVSS